MFDFVRRVVLTAFDYFEWRSFGVVVTQQNIEEIYHLVNSLIGQHTGVVFDPSRLEIKVGNTKLVIGSRVKFANDKVIVRCSPNSEHSYFISSLYFKMMHDERVNV
ncbi:hypothetical protein KJZ63_04315 [Patescibacteria group bacterium]|nr:hypothetical protein [Patescibacteria group bacterium]